MTRCSHEQAPFQLLHGEPHIFEEVLGLKFRISPDAFFQVNTAGAEALYQAVGELGQVGGDTILLDICCGTGEQWLCEPGSQGWLFACEKYSPLSKGLFLQHGYMEYFCVPCF